MSRKNLITLAKELDFRTEYEYFDYIIVSETNSQRHQVNKLIKAMKKSDQKEFLKYIKEAYGLDTFMDFFDIIMYLN